MKHLIAFGLAVLLGAAGLFAQTYKSRLPTPDEERKLAGVTDYIQDGPRFNFTLYYPGNNQQFELNATNNFVMFKSTGGESNATVLLPDPSTGGVSRRSYFINANGRCTIELLWTNSASSTFTIATNNASIDTWVSPTNCSFWLFNNNRTAWHIVPLH